MLANRIAIFNVKKVNKLMKMSLINLRVQQILPPLASVIGLLGVGGGIYGLRDPQAASEMLGIRISTPDSPAIPFMSFVGARNLGSGITIFALLYTGQKKAIGMSLMCGVSVAMADAWICSQNRAIEGKAVSHAVMGVALGLLGVGLYFA